MCQSLSSESWCHVVMFVVTSVSEVLSPHPKDWCSMVLRNVGIQLQVDVESCFRRLLSIRCWWAWSKCWQFVMSLIFLSVGYVLLFVVFTLVESLVIMNMFIVAPSPPVALDVTTATSSDLTIKWQPPHEPNGNVTHYVVIGTWIKDDQTMLNQRNYCNERK